MIVILATIEEYVLTANKVCENNVWQYRTPLSISRSIIFGELSLTLAACLKE